MAEKPTEESLARTRKLVDNSTKKSGTTTHPDGDITQAVVLGLAALVGELGRDPTRHLQLRDHRQRTFSLNVCLSAESVR